MLATAEGLVCHAPAKLNLYFELIARRDDGYHDVETLMVPISLYDTVTFHPFAGNALAVPEECGIDFHLQQFYPRSDSSQQDIPSDRQNLVVRALELLRQRSGTEQKAQVTLCKRIPAEAGLGGGSSDAAVALKLANRGWGLGWSRKQLMELAAELGSDVPFFLSRGAAIGRGRGEQLEPLPAAGQICAVVVVPPQGLSTAAVYRAANVPADPKGVRSAVNALQTGSLRDWKEGLHNRLEDTARTLSPWIDRVRSAMDAAGCQLHQMTGSGTGCFGLTRHRAEAHRIAARLRARNIGQVFAVNNVG
ncbi:MAG: 4-(cytidine 5'-diphospho)-2-C-methyl-D-erythritol kinase [Pirellulales bacterium]|nr:4-(cytidine 5'-diphospho)-2-C-methyl-D-erythritol kinase [Pirellulales bacterium]